MDVVLSVVLILTLIGSSSAEVCKTGESGSGMTRIFQFSDCPYGCCGEEEIKSCCEKDNDIYKLGIIVGASVAGGILVLSIVITIIYCCVKKQKQRKTGPVSVTQVQTTGRQEPKVDNPALPQPVPPAFHPPPYSEAPPAYSAGLSTTSGPVSETPLPPKWVRGLDHK